jgi:hypothetical protein
MERYGFPITDTRPFRAEGFTTLLGAELHTGMTEMGLLWHILAVGLPEDFAPYPSGETGAEVAERARKAGAFVAAAHPAWYGLTEADVRSLGAIHAIEIFNGTAADHNDKPDSLYMLDLLLMRGLRYSACATDDMHASPERNDALRGWVWVNSVALEPEAILESLKVGAYYSSTGPQIYRMNMEAGEVLRIHCSPANRIWVTGHGSTSLCVHGHGMREAEFNLKSLGNSPFCRVTVRDINDRRAWSNPIWR